MTLSSSTEFYLAQAEQHDHIAALVEHLAPTWLRQRAFLTAMLAQREGRDVAEAVRRFVKRET